MVAVLLGVAACGSSTGPPTVAGTAGPRSDTPSVSRSVVTTKLLSFNPEQLAVAAGTTVSWQVTDAIDHTVTTGSFALGGDGLRSSQQPDRAIDSPLTGSRSVSHTFTSPGTYPYYCSIHKGMNGEVKVTP